VTRKRQDTDLLTIWQQAGEQGDDGLRRLVQSVVQQVLEAEMTAFIGAEPYERNAGRRGQRNGYKPRTLKTRVGELELMVPKDRDGQFQTELFERYQRSEKALVLSIMQMYVEGVSTRKVREITEALCGLEISKSQVSALTAKLDEEVDQWRRRALSSREYRYLMADARYEKVRRGGEVVSNGLLIVVGVSEDGFREVLGTWMADSETEASWGTVFADLKKRGLKGVRYVVSDDHKGLRAAAERHFQGALWQRCQVHFVRNALGMVARRDAADVLSALRTVTEAPDREGARKAIGEAATTLRRKHAKVARLLEEHGEEILAVYSLPEPHRKRMRSTNMLERVNQEIKRRTRVVRIFPDEDACLRLASALMMELNVEWMDRIYLDMSVGRDQPPATGEASAAA
jgi:transposase-like protein